VISSELSKNIPKNVLLSDWLPQNDILGHSNTKLFLTHCGANGQFEALYNAVPMIAFPLFGDQFHNALRAESLGIGCTLNIHIFTSDELVETIKDILSNSSYRENIARRSAIFRGQRETPRERAVWWIEHIIHHGGSHLHSWALDMPWYEYLMLDILLVVVVIPLILVTVLITYLTVSCCRSKRTTAISAGSAAVRRKKE